MWTNGLCYSGSNLYVFVKRSLYEIPRSLLLHLIFNALIFFSKTAVSVDASHAYKKIERTNECRSLTLVHS